MKLMGCVYTPMMTRTNSLNPVKQVTELTVGGLLISTNTHPVTGEMVEFRTYYNHLGLVIGAEDEVDGLRLYTYDDAHQLT
ncbi:hypothetical protein CEH02_08760, partial [Streptococcus pyogenes]